MEYLTIKEVAERLKVSPRCVRNWIQGCGLPFIRAGGARVIRIRSDWLDEWLSRWVEKHRDLRETVQDIESRMKS